MSQAVWLRVVGLCWLPVVLGGLLDARSDEKKDKAKEKTFTNSVGMTFVRIEAGKFMMGSTPEERDAVLKELGEKEMPEWLKAEGPRHEVTISKDFFMGAHEVTQKQYEKVMGKNPSHFCATGGGANEVKGVDTSDFPVERVNWQDTQDFLANLNAEAAEKKAKRTYRLPTEAEWEYCCRAGKDVKEPFCFGKPSASISSTQANFDGNFPFGGGKKGPKLGHTCSVGSYPANAWGLFDMHGNVREWVQDWYSAGAYHGKDRKDPRGPEDGSQRIDRGGGWMGYGHFCRSALRYPMAPKPRLGDLGFRVVCSAE